MLRYFVIHGAFENLIISAFPKFCDQETAYVLLIATLPKVRWLDTLSASIVRAAGVVLKENHHIVNGALGIVQLGPISESVPLHL